MLYVKEVQGEWTIVMTANGVVGFIETKFLNTDFQSKQIVIKYEPKKLFIPEWDIKNGKIIRSQDLSGEMGFCIRDMGVC